ncbi:hypothetical protein WR25_22319 [Diploscapter pachys]|uniref:DNA topoisomerase n=1 Tax=Diploscapter pachys TaxID=2018661 RepID=A0A2A2L122_9BILA|nr:hypothetical protein WR25_22319 [Diploscapter pachys]
MRRVLFVAEKNDVAKGVAAILGQGQVNRRDSYSRFNKIYQLSSDILGQRSTIEVTSVSGHLMEWQFGPEMKNWSRVPVENLFDANIYKVVNANMQEIERTLRDLASRNEILVIWTDCDREGENIGDEIVQVCRSTNRAIDVYRAKFSEITPAAIHRAKNNLIRLDDKIVQAGDCRQELDLRIGAAFTRLQTLHFAPRFPEIFNGNDRRIVSYGPCQFPTLGFVVERFKQHINFVREPFWKLVLAHTKDKVKAEFLWDRTHLFDKDVVTVILEDCREAAVATVEEVTNKPKTKYRPVALDTVEFEKLAVRKLKMSAKAAMATAEKLYSQGWISYPRTETNIFPKSLNLAPLVQAQTAANDWGQFANEVLTKGPNPRNGSKTDEAHPPIHPLKLATKDNLKANEWRVYELVTRHFLACVSDDAKGHETVVKVSVGAEKFHATGLQVIDLAYLKVYVYEKWGDKYLPNYQQGEQFRNFQLNINEGQTSPPDLLTEADLIALMDKYGIGTDATHAEHIEKIKDREYVAVQNDGKFIPSFLGLALCDGYDEMGFKMSRPHLRAALEKGLVDICDGRKAKNEILNDYRTKYKRIFDAAQQQIQKLSDAFRRYLTYGVQPAQGNANQGGGGNGNGRPPPGNPPGPGGGPSRRRPDDGDDDSDNNHPPGPSSASGAAALPPVNRPFALLPSVPGTAVGRGGTRGSTRGARGAGRGGASTRGKKDAGVAKVPKHATAGRARTTSTVRKPRGSQAGGSTGRGAGSGVGRTANSTWTGNQQDDAQAANGSGDDQKCECGTAAVRLTVRKDGPNKGRQFYACPKGFQAPDKCSYFAWAD